MPRLTITLSPERHRALKETAVRRGKTIRSLVEESLDAYGVKTTSQAAALVARARERSAMTETEAIRLAVEETMAQRRRS
ncbi:MAG: CopG family transcriptional regulator [Acidobacteriota bacterium]